MKRLARISLKMIEKSILSRKETIENSKNEACTKIPARKKRQKSLVSISASLDLLDSKTTEKKKKISRNLKR